MKHKSRIALPILSFLTFGIVAGSVASENLSNSYCSEVKEANAETNHATTVYFLDNDIANFYDTGDTGVYIHYWGGTSGTDWNHCPSLTKVDGKTLFGYSIYSFTFENVDDNNTSVLFKNKTGGYAKQTKDQTMPTGSNCLFYPTGVDDGQITGGWVKYDGSYDPDSKRPIYYRKTQNQANWDTVEIHAWHDESDYNIDKTSWSTSEPAMTYIGLISGYRYYCYYLENFFTKLIFHSNDNPGTNQTGTQTVARGTTDNCANMDTSRNVEWKHFSLDYYLGTSANWVSLDSHGKSGYCGNYYTSSEVSQGYNQEMHVRLTYNGSTIQTYSATQMSLVTDANAQNFTKDSKDSVVPHTRFGDVSGYIDVRLNYGVGNNESTIEVCAHGVYNNGCYDVIVGNETRGYYYVWTSYDSSKDEWSRSDVSVKEGDTLRILNSTIHHQDPYNPTYAHIDSSGGMSFNDSTHVLSCTTDGVFDLYVVKDNGEINKISTVRKTRNVSFVNSKGSGFSTQIITKGSTAANPGSPSAVTGYTFDGWYNSSNNTAWDFSTPVNDDVELYAHWTPHTYYVAYNGNGSTSGSMSNSTGTYDTSLSLRTNAYSKTGYTFAGWATSSGGAKVYNNGQTFNSNELYTSSGGTKNLYAKWTANKYTVALNREGGKTGSTNVSDVTYDSAMPSATMPAKNGFAFKGYYDAKNGSGTKYYNADGSSARTWNKSSNATLYAYWVSEYFDYSVPLSDGVGLSLEFKSSFTSEHTNISKVVFNYPNPDKIEGEDDRTLTKEYTTFTSMYVGVNAAQLTEDITFEIYENGVKTIDGSVTIADVVKSKYDAGNAKTKDLCGSLLAYATYVQTAYSYNLDKLAIDALDDDTVENYYLNQIDNADLADDGKELVTHTGLFLDTSKYGISSGMNTTTIFRFYFECDEDELDTLSATLTKPDGTSFSNGMELSELKSEAVMVNGVRKIKRYYEISGIKPTDIKTLFKLTITKDGNNAGTCVMTYSVGSYLDVLNNTAGVASVYKNLAKATERYCYYATQYAA